MAAQDFDFENVAAIPVSTGEGSVRLLKKVVGVLGGPLLWRKDLEVAVGSLQRGFQALSKTFPAARMWSECMRRLLDVRPELSAAGAEPAPLHPLAILLNRQPGVATRQEVEACEAVAALVFYTLARGSTTSQNVLEGLKHFYMSNATHWQGCRRKFQTAQGLMLPVLDSDRVVVQAFAHSIGRLQDQGMYEPVDFESVAISWSTEAASIQNTEYSADIETLKVREIRSPTRFSCQPDFELLEFQVVQEEREPSLSQFRLLNDPNSLTEEEHSEFWSNMLPKLRQHADAAGRLHVASRVISELCGLSLRIAAGVPFAEVREKTATGFRRGSLHIDLRVGLIRRDFLAIAPRTDRERSRTHGRHQRTPIPPEIVEVLKDARARSPAARTLGDLLQAAGLTPTLCHSLANIGRTQPRAFTDLRIARSLTGFLLRRDFHPSIVSHTTGDITLVPRVLTPTEN